MPLFIVILNIVLPFLLQLLNLIIKQPQSVLEALPADEKADIVKLGELCAQMGVVLKSKGVRVPDASV